MASPAEFKIGARKESLGVFLFSGYSSLNYQYDVIHASKCLAAYGLPTSNIYIAFPESVHPGLRINEPINLFPAPNLFKPQDFTSVLGASTFKHNIAVFTGHGQFNGIPYQAGDDPSPKLPPGGVFSPMEIISAFKSIKDAELGILVVGACQAGVFNYLDTNIYDEGKFCIMGATGLHNSLNAPVPFYTDKPVMNVFLAYFHQWFASNPIPDIDGDNKKTLIDCFKYAGSFTSEILTSNRSEWHRKIIDLESKLRTNAGIEKDKLTPEQLLNAENNENELRGLLTNIHAVQEPWCLNANQFRHIIF
jgi:hypothetical protein